MVIGAHAADAEIMGGAAVLKHVDAGWRAVNLHLTGGEKGHKSMSPEDYLVIKKEEAAEAAKRLGAESVFLPYKDGELPINPDVQMAIADVIREYRPTIILTHWKGSIHVDHTNTYENVLASLFFAGLRTFEREFPPHWVSHIYFAENWEDEDGFVPEVYLDTTDVFDRYIHAIHAYSLFRGEAAKFPYEQWYRGASQMRGAEVGYERAVALMHHRTYYGSRSKSELLGPDEKR
jgi:LmbE family N-acetylglucosaminyl deacetylase